MTARDMTVEQRIARGVWASEDRFRLLVEHSSDLIVVIGRDRRILYATPASATVLGFDAGSLKGRTAVSMVHPEDWARSIPDLADFMRAPGGGIQLEVRIRHADGHWVTLEAHCRNLLAVPNVQGVVVNTRDVTQRKAAEELFALADVWDALHSERPYRRPWTPEAALDHIRRGSGTHFDPEIVPIFLRMIEEMNESHRSPVEERLP